MDLSATGEPVITREDTQVQIGIDLRPGTLALTCGGRAYEPYHASVAFAGVQQAPWSAQQVTFSAKGTDGKPKALTVDLLNGTYDGPRANIPIAIWKVVALAAASAGDLGITYTAPSGP
ncbi:hypothetical protein [Saccharothrix sp. ST-888]|uniref:hypothetical protein n=1 Tax=Saccharothrix sp. ST-888 TaxID=1427391 RepID=UPI0005EC7CE7|nr:hypothetical protein [Saccharothrix sp. ST-888]KJK59132.1 hypothetical protein UK12_06130 [Saccharothrix sp. ST-888]